MQRPLFQKPRAFWSKVTEQTAFLSATLHLHVKGYFHIRRRPAPSNQREAAALRER